MDKMHVWRTVTVRNKEHIKDENLLNILDDVKRMSTGIFGSKLKEIILYGSYARQRQSPESDMDIMFLFDESRDEIIKYRDRIVDIMVELSLKYDVLISITESSLQDFKEYVNYVPFYSNVYKEGVEVYAA
jgi:predicted nucleotidyltransferase